MARNNLTFDDLLFIARRVGVEVVAAPSSHRGQLGKMGTVVGITRHHTGTAETFKPTEDYPTYQVVKEGRAGLENSLSAFGLGRFRAIYVFSEFLSWHAGTWSYAGITDGNGHFLGIEAEGTGNWTEWQKDIYPRLCASALLFLGEGIDMMPRHADGAMPRGRKTDAANLPADFTATVANYLAHPELIAVNSPQEEIDMSAKDELWDAIVPRLDEMRTELDSIIARLPAIDATHVGVMDPDAGVRTIVLGLAGRKPETVDIKQLAAAVAPLVSANPGGLSDEDLQRIAKSVADEQAKRQAD